ncbi:hypothetical protein HPB48_010713 [Haemaphysalis longicornis]|uniref:Rho GTPase-activating protein pG1 and pG2 domain-containing protein n=1 Tax=Haemaphysalis longicornis TaxID=44386 RepID=A0A9J6G7W6_HAELO|nr:hypothetical protein HPB48_010713 [Haemaphysalis longicornis]
MDGVIEQLLHRREAGTNGGGGAGHQRPPAAPGGAECQGQRPAGGACYAAGAPAGFRLADKAQYALVVRIIDGDVGLPHNLFRTEPHGCLCVYTSQPELKYIRESLEKTLLANLEQEDRLPFHGLPLVMVFAGQGDCLREDGINRAQEPASAPSWTTAAAWTPCGWSRRCVRWWRASSGCTSTRRRTRSRGPGRTCG